jgi:hypothetical protein
MKIFDREINDCIACIYTSNINGVDVCSQPHEFKKMFRLNNRTFDEEKGHFVREIPEKCQFKKSITKEDIESFGFEATLTDRYFEKLTDKDLFTFTVNKNGTYSLANKKFLSFPMFDNINITSKPHLKFILQSIGFDCS